MRITTQLRFTDDCSDDFTVEVDPDGRLVITEVADRTHSIILAGGAAWSFIRNIEKLLEAYEAEA